MPQESSDLSCSITEIVKFYSRLTSKCSLYYLNIAISLYLKKVCWCREPIFQWNMRENFDAIKCTWGLCIDIENPLFYKKTETCVGYSARKWHIGYVDYHCPFHLPRRFETNMRLLNTIKFTCRLQNTTFRLLLLWRVFCSK